jgi:MSHA pilin protein MshA
MVIVILGILAATALPKFTNLEANARQGATEGVAGSLSSASAFNYANCSLNNHQNGTGGCITMDTCADLIGQVDGVTLASGTGTTSGTYYVADTALASTTNGAVDSSTCNVVDGGGGAAATFIAIASGN